MFWVCICNRCGFKVEYSQTNKPTNPAGWKVDSEGEHICPECQYELFHDGPMSIDQFKLLAEKLKGAATADEQYRVAQRMKRAVDEVIAFQPKA